MKNADLKRRIIDAAIMIFARQGFFEARVEDIARRAGVAKGTVYLYFKDKPALYAGVIDAHFGGAIERLRATIDEDVPASVKLMKLAQNWVGYMLKYKSGLGMSMLTVVENTGTNSRIMRSIQNRVAVRIGQIMTLVARIIEEGTKKRELQPVDPMVGAFYFLDMVRAAFTVRQYVPKAKDGAMEILRLMVAGLRGSNRPA